MKNKAASEMFISRRARVLYASLLSASLLAVVVWAAAASATASLANTYTVTNTNDSGTGSLRQAIIDANNNEGITDTIDFHIRDDDRNCAATTHVCTIKPTGLLPDITDPVLIDGYTQPGAKPNSLAVGNDAVLLVELSGEAMAVEGPGLYIKGGNSTVRGLVINRFKGTRYDRGNGIYLRSSGNRVEGCFIGTDATGTLDRGNASTAIFIGDTDEGGNGRVGADNNVIGGTIPAARNLLSGNDGKGIDALFSKGNQILGNYIGTTRNGNGPLGNTGAGILLNGSPDNVVGGTSPAAPNVISANGQRGIYVSLNGNRITGNFIGTNAAGTGALGNAVGGVLIEGSNNTVGGTGTDEDNSIAFNAGPGVSISVGTGNALLSNAIFGNVQLGIDLNANGVVQPNDHLDPDTGANNLQNFPEITSAISDGSSTIVTGTLASVASIPFRRTEHFRVEFFSNPTCDSSGHGEGRVFLGSTDVQTDSQGRAAFNSTLATQTAAGHVVTATATRLDSPGNRPTDTSEFSACREVISFVNEMNVRGNGVSIADGDATPSAEDHTLFGTVTGGTVSHTFTVENAGGAPLSLTGTPRVSIVGTNASDFTVTAQPDSPVPGGGQTLFTIRFSPSAPGLRTAAVQIANDDADENPYDFSIQGTFSAPPSITAGAALALQQGSTQSGPTIATVSDAETAAGGLTVTATNVPAGIGVSNIVNTNGNVTANVAAGCTANVGANAVELTVTDGGGATANASLTVNVSANNAPTLTYANPPPVAFNGSANVSPASGPSDNGGVAAIALLSQGTFNGTISVNASGVVSVGKAAPAGTHTITVGVTDNCGTTTDATFQLTVPVPTTPTILIVTNTDDSGPGSLRQTMLDANALPNVNGQPDIVKFDIPDTDPGCAPATHVCALKPVSPLPDITDPVVIDGYTQQGARANTLAVGDDALLLIELNGESAGTATNGLHLAGGGSTVRGLVINRFRGVNFASGNAVLLASNGNVVEGCFLGTDAGGTRDFGNSGSGIFGNGVSGNRVGGTTPESRNLISGNDGKGVDLLFSSGNDILGNYVGTTRNGDGPLGNTIQGMLLHESPGNRVGDATASGRNVVSGNGFAGIHVRGAGASANSIRGNFVGTSANGASTLGNNNVGVFVEFGAFNNVIGGAGAGEGNVISGNNGYGVNVSGAGTSGNFIQGNFIGTDVTGTAGRGNSGAGVNVESGAHDNVVVGNAIAANLGGGVVIKGASTNNAVVGNTIALNAVAGVVVNGGAGNPVLQNSIFSNGGLGLDLGGNGVTPNDPLDLDTGSNNLQNFPALTSAVVDATGVTIKGRLHSAQNAKYKIGLFASDSCDPSGSGEGQRFVGELDVTTGADGDKALDLTPLDLTPLKNVAAGTFLTATATRLDGSGKPTDTSEFSPCVAAVQVNNITAVVTNLNDQGEGSLRQAVRNVEAAGGGAVNFAPGLSGVITLTSGAIVIGADAPRKVNIVGPGSNRVVVSGNNASRVFNVVSGVVNVSGLTIANGFDDVGHGGGIVNTASLTLDNCRVVGNRSTVGGGGIANLTGGTLTVNNCDITNNVARLGGGIVNLGKLGVTNSNISHNAARPGAAGGLGGGGILNAGTDADNRIGFSTVSFNEAGDGAGGGGGIRNFSGLTVESCTVSENITNATRGGGGIRNDDVLILLNSTVSGNTVLNNFDGGGVSNGSEDSNGGNALVVINSTVSGNNSGGRGGGIRNGGARQAFVLSSTLAFNSAALGGGGVSNDGEVNARANIFARNDSASGGPDFLGALNSFGFNLVGKTLGAGIVPIENAGTDIKDTDPKLDPVLRNNGGTTRTHALLAGSPAIDAGGADVIQHPFNLPPINLSTDQRGRPRPGRIVGFTRDPIDIGAVEVGFNVSGRVASAAPLAGVSMTLSGGASETRTTTTDADGFYEFNDVARGDYVVIPQFFGATFFNARENVKVADDVFGVNFGWQLSAGNPNDHSDATIKAVVRVKDSSPAVFVRDATVTLSGPKSAVKSEASPVGVYEFTELPRNGDYKLVATHTQFSIRPVKCRENNSGANADGGCVLTNLPLDEPTVEFEAVPVEVAPTPPPLNDDFFSEGIVKERFNFGVLSLDKCDSAAGPLGVEQGDGQLKITPFASQRPAPCQSLSQNLPGLATEPSAFNGYVSVRDIDLNSLTSVSVRADETLTGPGAHTIFSAGKDSDTFFRIRVGDGSFQNTVTGQKNGGGKSLAAGAGPSIFFETSDPKFSLSEPFKRDADVYWRLRMEPVAPAAGLPMPAACRLVPADSPRVILFETSPDGVVWTPRNCAPVARSATHVATEQLAGLVGRTNTNPGTARFSDYKVADPALIKFNADSANRGIEPTPNVNEQEVTFKVERTGGVESGAVVGYEFDRNGAGRLQNGAEFEDCTAETGGCSNSPVGRLAFQPGSRTAFIKLRLHLDRLDQTKDQSLKIVLKDDDIAGGRIDGSIRTADVSIGKGHPLDRSDFFVRQHYLDFLNRNPAGDARGLDFWKDQMTNCGNSNLEVCRINVSAAFFLSIEFQRTGFVAYHFRLVSFGTTPRREEFMNDAAFLGHDVVVNQPGWEQKLDENTRAFVDDWLKRPAFKEKYDGLNSADYVDTLYRNAGVETSPERRTELVLKLLTNQTTRRDVFAGLLLPKAGTPEALGADEFKRQHFNRLFVLMQYFGYLRRDPDPEGFNFWLGKLNEFNGDFIKAEMVRAFLSSDEYRKRFGGAQSATAAGH